MNNGPKRGGGALLLYCGRRCPGSRVQRPCHDGSRRLCRKGAKSPDPQTAVNEIYDNHGEVIDVMYYNVMGQQSSKPFDGINIVVKRYSDGTTSSTKVRY